MGVVTIRDPKTGSAVPFRIAGDQPSPTEMERINQYFAGPPQQAAPAAEEPESQGNFFTGLGTGFAGSFAQLPGGITALGESVLGYTPGETAIGRAGQAISEAGMEGVEGIFGPQGDGWGSKIGQGIGSLTSFIVPGVAGARAAGALGRGAQLAQAARGGSQEAAKALGRRQAAGAMAATTPMGAGLGASDQLARIEQYVAQGGSVPDEDIRQAVRLGGAVGLTEAFPVSRIIDRSMDLLRKVPREARDQALATIGKRLRRAGRAGLEEGGQEVFAGIAQDLIEQGIYNPDAQIGQSAVDDMVVGGTAGGALQYLLDTLTRRQMATFESDATKEEQQNEDLLAEMDVLKQRMANAQENAARRAGPQALSGPEERLALPAPPGQLPPPPAGLPAPPEGPAPAPGQIEQQGIAGLLPRPTDFTAGREGVERAPGVSFPDRTKSQEQRDAEYARGIPPSEPVPPQGIAGLLPRPSDFTAGQEGVQRTPGVSIPETPTRPQLQEELDAQYARAREAEEARIAQENKSPETPSLPSGRTVGQNRPPKAQAEQVKALQEAARRPERATEEEIGASVEAEVQAEEVPQQKQQVQQIEAIQQALKEKRKPRVKASETAVKRVKQAERRAPKAVVDDVAEQTAPEPEGWSAADLSSRVVRKRDEVRKYTEDFNQVAIVDSPVGEWVIERVMGGGTQPTGFHVRHATDPDTEGVWVADTQKDAIEDVKARLMMDGYIPTESEVMGQRSEPRRERLKAIAQERAGQKPANKRRSQIGRMQEAAQSPFTAPPELVKRMRTRLNRAGLSDVGVEIEGLLLDDNGNPNVSIEGAEEVRDAKSAITLALDIYDPNMSDAELSAALGEVLSHEMVHAFRSLDLMTPEEYLSLQKAARENKVVRPDGQKREYSYLDYANAKNARFNMGLKPDQVMEEAIAEMYRAYTRPNNPLKLTGKPRSWWKKAIDFIKGIGRAGNDTGYIEPERVFESMSSGEMGARARGERRQGPRPDERQQRESKLGVVDESERMQRGIVPQRRPSAKNIADEAKDDPDQFVTIDTMNDEQVNKAAQIVRRYPGFKTNKRRPDAVIQEFKDHVRDNLIWLYNKTRDQHGDGFLDAVRRWYNGANVVSNKLGRRWEVGPEAAAAVIAVTSPQTEWNTNVSKAERIGDIYTGSNQSWTWAPEMESLMDTVGVTSSNKVPLYDRPIRNLTKADKEAGRTQADIPTHGDTIRGRSFYDLLELGRETGDYLPAARWLRLYDEAFNSRFHRELDTDGNFIGEPKAKTAWGSFIEIAKALEILENPTHAKISALLGNQHKVRNFYNNIARPDDDTGSITVAAAPAVRQ